MPEPFHLPRSDYPPMTVYLRARLLAARNWMRAMLINSPLRLLSAAVFLVVIWSTLLLLFVSIFRVFGSNEFVEHIALMYVFNFFFLALMAMLSLSTAVMIYGSAFRSAENTCLMTFPIHPRQIFLVRLIKAVIMASWALLLLGMPMMVALAIQRNVPLSFYPYFVAAFLAFILLPGSAGALVAVSLARWLPGSRRRIFWIICIVTTAIIIYFTMTIWRDNAIASLQSSGWIEHVFTQRDAIRGPLLPHTWLAAGLQAAIDRRAGEAMFYLMVTAANGLMAALIAVYIGGRWLPATCALTSTGNSRPQRITAITVPRFVNLFAFVWPKPVRLQVQRSAHTDARSPAVDATCYLLRAAADLYYQCAKPEHRPRR